MNVKFILSIFLCVITIQAGAIELEGEISEYVQEACDNELMNYCNDTPQLKSYLTVYAESFEEFMQAIEKEQITTFYLKHYSAGLCIENLYPESNVNEEIKARMKSYLIYSKERFSLLTKSNRKAYEAKVHELISSDDFIPEACSSMV